jgi:exosome complex RNA-binding protein Rrp42 (RNase PH superfamily)
VAGSSIRALMLPVGVNAREDEGSVQVIVELGSICSTRFQSNKQGEEALALSKTISRIVSKVVDPVNMKINDGLFWDVRVTVFCTSFDGNVLDAALLATVLCLVNTKLPDVAFSPSGELSETEKPSKALVLESIPISLTFAVYDCEGQLLHLADPTAMEEDSSKSLVTVVVMAKSSAESSADSAPVIVHKPGGMALQPAHLAGAIKAARSRAREILTLMRADLAR